MRAIVLSGGGAKGSYQVGVWKALKRLHLSYSIVTGTSVGALNGALMVQKDYRIAKKLWKTLNLEYLFHQTPKKKNNLEVFKLYQENFFKNGGMDTTKIEEIIQNTIHPKKFYHSKINYGLVTYNLTNRKAEQLEKAEIPEEKLTDYLMASATCYPAFQMKTIEDKKYIDGGFSDNIPMNLALSMGATELIVVDLKAPGKKKKIKEKVPITYITPHNAISFFLNFDEEEAKRNMKFGYNDTLKAFQKLEGDVFTFRKNALKKGFQIYKDSLEEMIEKCFRKRKNTFKQIRDPKKFQALFNQLTEEVGKILNMDETKIYRFSSYRKNLKICLSKIKEKEEIHLFKEKNEHKIVHNKWFILYLYQNIEQGNWNKIQSFTTLFQQDVLRALYLYVVIHHV